MNAKKLNALVLLFGALLVFAAGDASAQPSASTAATSATAAQAPRGARGARGPRPSIPGWGGNVHTNFNPALPTLWIIGDSTAKNSQDNGSDHGLWGWAHEVDRYFDLSKINVENQALGGTSSRSFYASFWAPVAKQIKPGDYLMIQFGANDNGFSAANPGAGRASMGGNDEKTVEATLRGGQAETVHSFGWYLRKMAAEAREKGATPILVSLLPRDDWSDGKLAPKPDNHAIWTGEAAKQDNIFYIDMNRIIIDTLTPMGEDAVKGRLYRAEDHTHTTLLGAQYNAWIVVSGIKALPSLKLNAFLGYSAQTVSPAPATSVAEGKMTDVAAK